MERKSMGSFIAALRKANGFTQKDLAEKLNVSDKSVSRWERDEGSPDLSLIPVIAEIFGVTSDELLRGERKPVEENISAEDDKIQKESPRVEKQKQRILAAGLSQYTNRSLIAVCLAGCGLIAALICNFAFLRAMIGFYLGVAFLLIAVISQIVCMNSAFFAVNNDEFEDEKIGEYKRKVIRIAENIIGLVVGILALMLPLVMYIDDMYCGLPSESFWKYGLIYAGIALIIWLFVTTLINLYLSEFNVLKIDEKQNKVCHKNLKLKYFCLLLFIALVFITAFTVSGISDSMYSELIVSESFDSFAEFKEFMEQDVSYESEVYDDEGNMITYNRVSEEKETIEGLNGEILCEFVWRNQTICGWGIGSEENNYLPVTVQSWEDVERTGQNVSNLGSVGIIVYLLEAVAVGILYYRKRER